MTFATGLKLETRLSEKTMSDDLNLRFIFELGIFLGNTKRRKRLQKKKFSKAGASDRASEL